MARLYVVGLSHKTAPIEVREPFAFADGAIKPALGELLKLPGVAEAMLISTCNRVELYAVIEGNDAPGAVERYLIDGRGLSTSLRAHLYMHDGELAVRHLFRVAASLDSMVVGESQILGQVKEAYGAALEAGSLGPILTRTLPRAFAAAKRVRSETQVARSSASIASAAVDLAAQIFGDLKGRDVLVVGAGKMGDLSARHLKASGIGSLYVVNRTLERAQELAARLGGKAAPWEELDKWLAKVDIVLCSTGAAEPVIRRDRVEKVMRARRGRWLFLIDIAVPRDVDPAVGDVENVYLYDVDALQKVVEDNLAGRAREAQDAHVILEQELTRFFALELSLGVVPTIKLLRSRFIEVAHAEAERTLGKLQNASDKDKAQVKALAESIVNKLLHAPLTALKKAAADDPDSELADTVRALFDLHTGHTEEISLDPLAEVPVPLKTGQEGYMLRIATRGSALALWQAHHVRDTLRAREPGLEIELEIIKTRGDKILDRSLSEVGGKGLFVKEIEEALLDGRAQIAVHSMKDLPAEIPAELMIAAVPEREDPRDALVVAPGIDARDVASLPPGARVGTSSLRRMCQLHARRADLQITPLRGNVDTRLGKVQRGELDAIVLACAGLKRLGHGAAITCALSLDESLPAIAQGALAIECRKDDAETRRRLGALDHPPTAACVAAERGFLARLEGDCKTPMAAHAILDRARLVLDGLIGMPDGSALVRGRREGAVSDGVELGRALAEELLGQGGDRILRQIRSDLS